MRGRCTNWQTGREAEKRGDQDRQRQGTRGKTKAGDGRKRRKKERYRQVLSARPLCCGQNRL